MKAFVAVTDPRWYEFLRTHPGLGEVNFWQPGGQKRFAALAPGEPFLFKLRAPYDAIAGGGFYVDSQILPIGLAWEAFGEGNGAASLQEMLDLIAPLKKTERVTWGDHVGCIILRDLFFFDREDWIARPPDFAPEIVVGKTYDVTSAAGAALWGAVQERLHRTPAGGPSVTAPLAAPGLVGETTAWGPGYFRVRLTEVYGRCAITRERATPVLDAAVIRPVAAGGAYRPENGIVFRLDVKRLFQEGYVTVLPNFEFRVSERLARDFKDGRTYRRLHESPIWLPREPRLRPSSELLQWHNDSIFKG